MDNKVCRKVLEGFKYYKGEDIHSNPYPYGDVRERFWHGEMMFSGCVEHFDNVGELYQSYKNDAAQWCEWLKEHKPNQSARMLRENNEKQLIVAFYIVVLFGKWCPYDSEDFIFDY